MPTVGLSSRTRVLAPSPTLGMTAKANALKAEGKPIISFAAGEPDFPSPQAVCDATIEALNQGFTKYSPTAGLKELREAVATKLLRDNRLKIDPGQVCINNGAKHSIYNALMVLVDPGDEVILLSPFWATYLTQIELTGAQPVIVETDAKNGHQPDIDAIRDAITPRTKAMIINSPCNPTGAVFPRETMKQIAALMVRHGIWVISDEIYERLTYGAEHQCFAALGQEVADQTVTVGGCSKAYSMTGWRVGYAAAPEPVIRSMVDFQEQVTSNVNTFVQKGAIKALTLDPSEIEKMRAEFQARRDLMGTALAKIPGISIAEPAGAFYYFVDFKAYVEKFSSDEALAEFFLERANVATVHGSCFNAPGFIRFSYATSRENIQEGVERVRNILAEL